MTAEKAFRATSTFFAETRPRELDKDGNIVPFDKAAVVLNSMVHHGMLDRRKASFEKWDVIDSKTFGIIYNHCNSTPDSSDFDNHITKSPTLSNIVLPDSPRISSADSRPYRWPTIIRLQSAAVFTRP
jgi:hypothetical protein